MVTYMLRDGHLKKGNAFEECARRWSSDREAPSAIEDVFNAAVHYVAYGIIVRHQKDIDSHSAQMRFLKGVEEFDLLDVYYRIEKIRISSVYGGGWNGDRVEKALELLEKVKEWTVMDGE